MEYAVEADVGYKTEQQSNKKKKIGFFKRWMLKAVKEAVEYERQKSETEKYSANLATPKGLQISREPVSIDQPDRAIQFTVYNANGGRVVETRRYDRQKDRNHQSLYVITADQEFGKEIDKIITMESLR